MSKHTPGPWTIEPVRPYVVDGRLHTIVNNERYPTAFVPAWDDPLPGEVEGAEEAKANARLIAAAPEMLQVLKWAEEHAAESEAGRDDAWYQNLAKLEAVIAKAEGRNV